MDIGPESLSLYPCENLILCWCLLSGDIYVHADLHGATSCVIKNASGKSWLSSVINTLLFSQMMLSYPLESLFNIQYESKVWANLLITGFFINYTIFYIVE